MLEIVDLKKDYPLQDQVVHALNGLSLCFRRNEFVSVLGPSGCGKTTLLNIVGGLDRYTSGDLLIDGVSTKEFKDKDWDNYRNHRVGFVFQSYNLIPHQTVLENVELALTLSGIKRDERKRRAIEVLNKVGLGDKLKSKPNQLSGGQMQRVSIARALVNDPEIILADEPTGALDSKTSVQIMEILKEVSKDRLVIMVTHNPDLANTYSSRIIKLLDGELVEDSMPYSSKDANKEINKFKQKQEKEEQKLDKNGKPKQKKKKSMSFFTSLFLSFRNLLTKKGRTILVSFAGSIGIIGIALILAISTGFSNYTNKIQEDTLSTYPITIQAKSVDFSSVINSLFLNKEESDSINHDKDGIYPKDTISNIFGTIGESLNSNNLEKFYKHLNDNYDQIDEHINAIKYTYDINLEFYMNDPAKTPVQPNSNALIKMLVTYSTAYFEDKTHAEIDRSEIGFYTIRRTDGIDYSFFDRYNALQPIKQQLIENGSVRLSTSEIIQLSFILIGFDASTAQDNTAMSMLGSTNMIYEMIDNEGLIREQYDILGTNGRLPSASNEAVLVLDKNNEIDEYVLYSLGLMSETNMTKLLTELVKGNKFIPKIDYDEILGVEYKTLDDSDYYIQLKDQSIVDYRTYKDAGTQEDPNELYNMAEYYKQHEIALNNTQNKIKIVGVLRLKDNVDKGSLPTGLAYTNKFTQDMIEHYNNSVGVSSNNLSEIHLDNPSTISIYVKSFDSKQAVQEFINRYNESAENGDEITYVDYVGLIMSAVSTIITSITYVLIAFVSVSLIVSSIMIGIITYISVIERTKEIGVLRSVGASKRDVKHVFTAESFIIGLTSGVFGIIVSLLLTIPINIVFKSFTGISGLASLSPIAAIVLIAISVGLTFISGLIPSSVAGKKDPVIALRSE